MFVDPKNLSIMDQRLRHGSMMSELCLPVVEAWGNDDLIEKSQMTRERRGVNDADHPTQYRLVTDWEDE